MFVISAPDANSMVNVRINLVSTQIDLGTFSSRNVEIAKRMAALGCIIFFVKYAEMYAVAGVCAGVFGVISAAWPPEQAMAIFNAIATAGAHVQLGLVAAAWFFTSIVALPMAGLLAAASMTGLPPAPPHQ